MKCLNILLIKFLLNYMKERYTVSTKKRGNFYSGTLLIPDDSNAFNLFKLNHNYKIFIQDSHKLRFKKKWQITN